MKNDKILDIENQIFFEKYVAIRKIGEGSFGKIFTGKDIKTNDKFAIKFEIKRENNLLKKEAYTMLELKSQGLPKVYSYGTNNDYNILVMELLGDSLENCFEKSNKRMSFKTVSILGIDMITLIKFVHTKGYLHRDIKPDNYMFGRESKNSRLYMIDFGLCKKYLDSDKKHVPIQQGKKLVGTARYASINTHRGLEQGRRDDLESIGYIMIYLIKGSLPWQGLNIKPGEDHYTKIYQKKMEVKTTELCSGLPKHFSDYIEYVRKLKYEETPNYEMLINLFKNFLKEEYKTVDIVRDYEWLNSVEPSSKENNKENVSLEKQDSQNLSRNNSNMLTMIMNKSMKVSKNSLSNNPDKNSKSREEYDNELIENRDKIFQLDEYSFE